MHHFSGVVIRTALIYQGRGLLGSDGGEQGGLGGGELEGEVGWEGEGREGGDHY